MDACRICSLIFDAKPIEIGRSPNRPDICIICEDAMYYDIELKPITTVRAHLELDEHQIAAIIDNPQPLVNDLEALLRKIKQPADRPRAPAKRPKKQRPAAKPASKAKREKAVKPLLHCQYCSAPFLKEGFKARHEARCVDNPANAHQGDE